MLDYFGIFTRGGALLWTLQFTAMRHNPIEALDALIRSCLLEERSGVNTFSYSPKTGAHQALKWTFHNGLNLVFVAVYQKTLSLLYVDELLQCVKDAFVAQYKPSVYGYKQFDNTFNQLLKECESRAEDTKRPTMRAGSTARVVQQNGHATSRKAAGSAQAAKGGKPSSEDEEDAGALSPAGGSSDAASEHSDEATTNDEDNSKAFDVSKLPKGGMRGGLRGRGGVPPKPPAPRTDKKIVEKKEAPKKKARNWNVMKGDGPSKLDYSAEDFVTESESDAAAASDSDFVNINSAVSRMDVEEEEEEEEEDFDEKELMNNNAGKPSSSEPKKRGLLGSFMSNLAMSVVGKQSLSREDIEPALADMKRKLMERNVAEEIAQNICDSVARSLEGQKLSSFTGVSSFVRKAFEEALSGILNKRQVDVLLDIKKAQARGKPYVIVFCGVNGVGKSTNLAKIAYWLGQHNIKVTIAACDTFRAGAVEQLKTHCMRLKVPLYERGYEKDPAKVAYEAVKQAEREGRDVVLVDTAGRMQDNEPLMRALSNLINVNEPNLVLFVGEALVGNDAVDQLVKFNRALHDLAPPTSTTRHVIDGIVLTKFDTIDDKVGAAVSMVYASSAPIMFVGCGQTYVDLKKLNVKSVVNSLLK